MTLDEAIKRLAVYYQTLPLTITYKDIEAIKLGIEALKWRQRCMEPRPPVIYRPLPGETRE